MAGFPPLCDEQTFLSDALTNLLLQMKASDANLLNASQRSALNPILTRAGITAGMSQRRKDLAFAALKALEQIGDATSISAVERLATMQAETLGQERIKQAAIECLPALRQNASSVQQSQVLLRAAQPPAPDPDTRQLLRAAPSANTPPDMHTTEPHPPAPSP